MTLQSDKTFICLLAAWCLCGLGSCVNDDTDFSDIIERQNAPAAPAIEFDLSPLAEEEEIDPEDSDYLENSQFEYRVNIEFRGDEAVLTGSPTSAGASVDGAHVTFHSLNRSVQYTVTGTTTNGSLKFYGTKKLKLTLNGAHITNPSGAAINCQNSKSMYVVVAGGTDNSLTDGSSYSFDNAESELEDMKGAFFSEGQIIFSGQGSLTVNGNCRHGIASDDYILFRPGLQVNVTSEQGNAIKANDGITIRGSVLNLLAKAPGSKGINSEAFVDIEGGRTTVICTGESLVTPLDTTTSVCIKADSTVTVRSGILRLKATGEGGKGINAKQTVSFEGGDVQAVTLGTKGAGAPKTVKSDLDIRFCGGKTYLYSLWSKPADAGGEIVISDGHSALRQEKFFWEIIY